MAAPRPKHMGPIVVGGKLTSVCFGLRAKSVSSQILPQGLGQVLETQVRVVEEHGSQSRLCPELTE